MPAAAAPTLSGGFAGFSGTWVPAEWDVLVDGSGTVNRVQEQVVGSGFHLLGGVLLEPESGLPGGRCGMYHVAQFIPSPDRDVWGWLSFGVEHPNAQWLFAGFWDAAVDDPVAVAPSDGLFFRKRYQIATSLGPTLRMVGNGVLSESPAGSVFLDQSSSARYYDMVLRLGGLAGGSGWIRPHGGLWRSFSLTHPVRQQLLRFGVFTQSNGLSLASVRVLAAGLFAPAVW